MFVAACLVGPFVAGMTVRDVVAGFPVSILILVAGVTYFFSTAHLNGTLDLVLNMMLAYTRGRRAVMPALFFVLAAVMTVMGSPQAGLATGPVGMSSARRAGVDPLLMVVAINCGICAGAFAPTSLFGVITFGIAQRAGIEVTTTALLGVAVIANLALLLAAFLLFSGRSTDFDVTEAPLAVNDARQRGQHLTGQQTVTLVCILGLLPAIIGTSLLGAEADIGVVLLSLGALLAVLDPPTGARAFARIDWSTAFVVGGIVTYVGVLQKLDAVNLLGQLAMTIGTPLIAGVVICMVAALVSAFASTTGVLAALVPMAVPPASSGAVPGWALITTLGVSATIVDASPFSNTGATLIACAPDEERPRLRVMLLRWSMLMVVAGPLVLLPLLVALG